METQIFVILWLVGSIIITVVAVVGAIIQGQSADKAMTERLDLIQSNREAVAALERQFQESGKRDQQKYELLAAVLRVVSPITPIVSDDKLSDLMDDITTPGPEVEEPDADGVAG